MNLSDLEKNLNFQFKNKALLRQALIHRSYLNEHPEERSPSNERLEFLGDAILEFAISKLLFETFPKASEGFLTALRSQIVQTKTLSLLAGRFRLGEFLLLSKGEEESGGRQNPSLLENALEAIVGAIFLDQGMAKASSFINEHFGPIIKNISPDRLKDPKSLLQEKTQEKEKITPTYKVLKEKGPEHAKTFTIGVYLLNRKLAQGSGHSKQEAEEEAAKRGLRNYETKFAKVLENR